MQSKFAVEKVDISNPIHSLLKELMDFIFEIRRKTNLFGKYLVEMWFALKIQSHKE